MEQTGQERQKLHQKITENKISRLVMEFSPPAIVGVFLAAVFNMIDSYFAKTLGTEAVAAVGVVFSMIAVIQAVGYFIGMGGASLLSRTLGEQDDARSCQIIKAVGILTLLFALLFVLAGNLFLRPLLRMLGAGTKIMEYAVGYGRYVVAVSGIMLAAFVLSNLLRAMGKPGCAMWGTIAGVVMDVIFCIWLVQYKNMGMAGIGIAVVAGQMAMLLVLAGFFFREWKTLSAVGAMGKKSHEKNWMTMAAACLGVAQMGMPSLFRQGLGSIAVVMLNRVAGEISTELQSAMSITAKVVLLLFSVAIGCSQALQPIVGFNFGAGQEKRVKQAFWNSVLYGTIGMTVLAAGSYLLAPWLLSSFTRQQEVLDMAVRALRYECMVLPTVMFANGANILFQAWNRPVPASFIAAFRQGIFFLPLLFLLPHLWGAMGIYLAQPLADLATFFACIPFIITAFSSTSQS